MQISLMHKLLNGVNKSVFLKLVAKRSNCTSLTLKACRVC